MRAVSRFYITKVSKFTLQKIKIYVIKKNMDLYNYREEFCLSIYSSHDILKMCNNVNIMQCQKINYINKSYMLR